MKMAEECLKNEIYLPDSIGKVIPPGYGYVKADDFVYAIFIYNGEDCYCTVEESNDTVLNMLDTRWGKTRHRIIQNVLKIMANKPLLDVWLWL